MRTGHLGVPSGVWQRAGAGARDVVDALADDSSGKARAGSLPHHSHHLSGRHARRRSRSAPGRLQWARMDGFGENSRDDHALSRARLARWSGCDDTGNLQVRQTEGRRGSGRTRLAQSRRRWTGPVSRRMGLLDHSCPVSRESAHRDCSPLEGVNAPTCGQPSRTVACRLGVREESREIAEIENRQPPFRNMRWSCQSIAELHGITFCFHNVTNNVTLLWSCLNSSPHVPAMS